MMFYRRREQQRRGRLDLLRTCAARSPTKDYEK